jgi:endonuclease/exonuclease/phosphatase family metal-dependent hydrolase
MVGLLLQAAEAHLGCHLRVVDLHLGYFEVEQQVEQTSDLLAPMHKKRIEDII